MANNLTTTTEGYVLDARQGVILNTSITSLNERITSLEENMNDDITSSDIDGIVV